MKNLIKLNIIFLAILIIFSSKSIAADRILPLPKSKVDQETKIITAKIKEIYPHLKDKVHRIYNPFNFSRINNLSEDHEKLNQIENIKDDNYEILLVDNKSRLDPIENILLEFPNIKSDNNQYSILERQLLENKVRYVFQFWESGFQSIPAITVFIKKFID